MCQPLGVGDQPPGFLHDQSECVMMREEEDGMCFNVRLLNDRDNRHRQGFREALLLSSNSGHAAYFGICH